jgi:hypothetical protein
VLPGAGDDMTITSYGIGLTDIAKNVAASSDRGLAGACDVDGFAARRRV